MTKNKTTSVSRCETDDLGDTHWYNKDNQLHRIDGPAVEYADDGYKAWYLNGVRHREDGPAIEASNGEHSWWINDIRYYDELTYWLAVTEYKKRMT